MSKRINVKMNVYGAFRRYTQENYIIIEVANTNTLQGLKKDIYLSLVKHNHLFDDQTLIDSSAIAKGNKILNDTVSLSDNDELSILPPVSGG